MSFSKRMGYEPEKKPLQFDSMDNGLRMAINNVIRSNDMAVDYDTECGDYKQCKEQKKDLTV